MNDAARALHGVGTPDGQSASTSPGQAPEGLAPLKPPTTGPDREGRTALPIRVRRARPSDRDAVLAFASRTWDGWDYIPHAWAGWIDAPDGVFLVALPVAPSGGTAPEVDVDGRPLDPDVPVAITRVALVSASEAWLEGIRVDPRVRGRSVATHLQIAELHWAAVHGASVIRYITAEDNEGSHRLGAHHGFRVISTLRGHMDRVTEVLRDGSETAGEAAVMSAGDADRAARSRLFHELAARGLVVDPRVARRESDRLWSILEQDPTLARAAGLYEFRPWAVRSLTRTDLDARIARSELVIDRPWPHTAAVAIIGRESRSVEDPELTLSLLAGEPDAALRLATLVRRLAGVPIGVHLPDPDPPLFGGDADGWARAGYPPRKRTSHILERRFARGEALPDPAGVVVFEEPPRPIAVPPGP